MTAFCRKTPDLDNVGEKERNGNNGLRERTRMARQRS